MWGIVKRARAIMAAPRSEWPAVSQEFGSGKCLFYLSVLALIPPLAGFVGASLIGGYVPIIAGLTGAALSYALSFAIVYAVALLVDMLASTFEGEKNFATSLRLTVYSFTPVWLAGIFLIVPGASFLTLLGAYGIYLVWTGLPVLKKVPSEKALPYAASVAAWALVLLVVVNVTLTATFTAPR